VGASYVIKYFHSANHIFACRRDFFFGAVAYRSHLAILEPESSLSELIARHPIETDAAAAFILLGALLIFASIYSPKPPPLRREDPIRLYRR
jgi:hypothetical protein